MKRLFILFLFPSFLLAKDLDISWKDVPGNNGYQIEIKKSGDLEAESIQVPKNKHIFLNLSPGEYLIRVAALNKFKRASTFSEWKSITLTDSKQKQSLNLDQSASAPSPLFIKLIPGVIQWQNKDKWKSYGYWAFFLSMIYEGNRQRIAGNILADNPIYNPQTITLLTYKQPPLVSYVLIKNRDLAENQYDTYQNNQKKIGLLTVIGILIHFYDARYYNRKSMTHSTSIYFNFYTYHSKIESGGIISVDLKY